MRLFKKPIDPAAEYIENLNQEAKLREAASSASLHGVLYLPPAFSMDTIHTNVISGDHIYTDSTSTAILTPTGQRMSAP